MPYNPHNVRVWEPTPQTAPEQFSDADIKKEIRYLRATNRRQGANTLRTLAIVRLLNVLAARRAGPQLAATAYCTRCNVEGSDILPSGLCPSCDIFLAEAN